MINVTITDFRANLLKYLNKVKNGEQINVTSKGAALATLSPPISKQDASKAKLQKLAETATFNDVLSPIESDWDALK